MKKSMFLGVLLTLLFALNSCEEPGCTDPKSLNYDVVATMDDGSCRYSRATFYASSNMFNNIPIARIDVSVNDNIIGNTTAIYPNGVGNCSAPGTVSYQFVDGDGIDWNATVYLVTGATIFTSGRETPNRVSECIKINVTR